MSLKSNLETNYEFNLLRSCRPKISVVEIYSVSSVQLSHATLMLKVTLEFKIVPFGPDCSHKQRDYSP